MTSPPPLQVALRHLCSQCNAPLFTGDRFCETCGTPCSAPALPSQPCNHCGALALDAEGFCQDCGLRSMPEDPPLQLQLSSRCAALSDRGLRRRLNQDAIALLNQPAQAAQPAYWGLILCDGIGSASRAELAAQVAVATISQVLQNQITSATATDRPLVELLEPAMAQAQTAVTDLARGESNVPATTVVAALVRDRQLAVGWLGDSRAYWLSSRGGYQITQDHSDSVQHHQLTRWLGADADFHQFPPQFTTVELPGSGYVLLCSDGLWNYAPEPEHLWQFLQRSECPEAAETAAPPTAILTQRLIDFARSQGGHDNISAALLQISIP